MKSKLPIHRGLVGLCSITFCLLTAGQSMAQNTWTGTAGANWNDPSNWSLAAIPAANQALVFTGTIANNVTSNDIGGLTTGSITFGNDGLASTTVFTLGTLGQSITLGGDINATGVATGGTSLTDIINLDLSLNATRTINCNASHNITIHGNITGAFSLNKAGTGAAGTLTLTGNNTFSGVMNINTGGISISNISDTGFSHIGLASSIRIGNQASGGTLTYTGAGATTARTVTIGSNSSNSTGSTGGATISNNGANGSTGLKFSAPTFNNPVTLTVAGTIIRGLTLTGNNTDANEIQGIIQDGAPTGTGIIRTALTKDGDGIWTLSGNNTYTGSTAINRSTLNVTKIADSGDSNLGFGTTVRFGNQAGSGTLNYTGAGNATARTIQVGNGSASGATGGAIIKANGLNGGTGLKFTAPNFTTEDTVAITALRTLTLNGGNTDANEVQGVIADVKATVTKTNLTKADGGRWILAGTNTYTGTTTVSGGVLQLNSTGALPATSPLVLAGAVLGLGAADFTLPLGALAGQVSLTTFNAGFAAYDAHRIVNLGSGASLVWGTGSFFNSGQNTMVLGAGTATHTLDFQNPIDLGATNRTVSVVDGGDPVDAKLSGVITGTSNLAKSGSGTLLLGNLTGNSYTGGTTLSAGTLLLDTIADSSPSAIGTTGTLTLGGGTLSYTGASAATTARAVTLTASSTIHLPSGNLTLAGKTSGGFVLTKTGSGTLILSGSVDNSYLLLNASAGEVHLAKDIATNVRAVAGIVGIGNGATVKLIGPGGDQIFSGNSPNQGVNGMVTGGTLDLNGRSEAISFLNGTGGVVDGAAAGGSGTTTLTVGQTDVLASFGGVIQNTTGTLNLSKIGTGTQTLSGANTYTGSTTVSDGTLLINGNSSAAIGAVNVNGVSTLGGNGIIGGSVTLTASANLSPGDTAAVGTLSILGNLNISAQAASTGKLIYALDSIAASDKVAVTGTLNIGSGALAFSDFNFSALGGLQDGTYTLITSSGIIGSLDSVPANLTGAIGTATGTLRRSGGGTGNDIELVISTDYYADWSGGAAFDGDANNDGVDNGLAWLLGSDDKDENANDLLPKVTEIDGKLQLKFSMLNAASRSTAVLQIQHSSDLGINDAWTPVTVPEEDDVIDGVAFTIIAAGNKNNVTAVIPQSDANAGKLFGRLKGVR